MNTYKRHRSPPDIISHVIVAPESDLAFRAADNSLSSAAGRWYCDFCPAPLQQFYPIGFNKCIHRKCRTGLSLAMVAVAAMNDYWPRGQFVAHVTASAATFASIGLRHYSSPSLAALKIQLPVFHNLAINVFGTDVPPR